MTRLALLLAYTAIIAAPLIQYGASRAEARYTEDRERWAEVIARSITSAEYCAAAHAVELAALVDTVDGLVGVSFEVEP